MLGQPKAPGNKRRALEPAVDAQASFSRGLTSRDTYLADKFAACVPAFSPLRLASRDSALAGTDNLATAVQPSVIAGR